MGQETDSAHAETKGALKKIKASGGKVQGNFYYAGKGKGDPESAGLVITVTARDKKGSKALKKGKSVRKELKANKFALGTVEVINGKLTFTLHSGSASTSHLKTDFKKSLATLDGLKLLKSALIRAKGGEVEEDDADISAEEEVEEITLTEAELKELKELEEEQSKISDLNSQLSSFLAGAETKEELQEDLNLCLSSLDALQKADPQDEAAIKAAREDLVTLLEVGPSPFPAKGTNLEIDVLTLLSETKQTDPNEPEQTEQTEKIPLKDSKASYLALKTLRNEINTALSEAYLKVLAPLSALAAIATKFAALDTPVNDALASLNSNWYNPIAMAVAQERIRDLQPIQSNLQTLITANQVHYDAWQKQSAVVTNIEKFTRGDFAGKELWSEKRLAKKINDIRDQLSAVMSQAAEGHYMAALNGLPSLKKLYDEAISGTQNAKNFQTDFGKLHNVEAARGLIRELRAVTLDDFSSKMVAELSADVTISAEKRQTIAKNAHQRLLERIVTHEKKVEWYMAPLQQEAINGAGKKALDEYMQDINGRLLVEVDALTKLKESLPTGKATDSSELTDLEKYRSEKIAAFEIKPLQPWEDAATKLEAFVIEAEQLLQRLEGLGAATNPDQISTVQSWRSHRFSPDGYNELGREIFLREIHAATTTDEIDHAVQKAQPRIQTITAWIAKAEEYSAAATAPITALKETATSGMENYNKLQDNARKRLTALNDLLTNYERYSEVPKEYTTKRRGMLDELQQYVDSDNTQAIQKAIELLERYEGTDHTATFPPVNVVLAMFTKVVGTTAGTLDFEPIRDFRKEAATAAASIPDHSFKKVQDALKALVESDNGKKAPKRCKTLTSDVEALEKRLKTEGLYQGFENDISTMLTKLREATGYCAGLAAALVKVEEAKTRLTATEKEANRLLGKDLGNWFFDGTFTGRLEESEESPEKSGRIKDILALAEKSEDTKFVESSVETATKLLDDIESKWKTYTSQDDLAAHIGQLQKDAEKKEADEKEAREARQKEWDGLVEKYNKARSTAMSKDVPDEQIEPLDTIRDNAAKTRETRLDEIHHQEAVRQLSTVLVRMEALAENPEHVKLTAKQDLNQLPKKWAHAVAQFQASVAQVVAKLKALTVPDEQQPTVDKAIQNTESVRSLFNADAFNADIMAITFAGDNEDGAKAARERGLATVRAYKHQLNHPMLRALLSNPFATVPLGAIHKCLGDLDLNLQRSI